MKLDDKVYRFVMYHNFEGDEIIVRFDTDTYGELVERFKEFSLACGFQPDTVNEYLNLE